MSRAFVKEDAGGEDVVVTHRAPLPPGVPNLVTPAGLAALERERSDKTAALAELLPRVDDSEAQRRLATLEEELELLLARIATAEVVTTPADSLAAGVGATVEIVYLSGPQTGRVTALELVGVDEADPLEGKVAFTAPVAQALLGLSAGATAEFVAGDALTQVRLERVTYQY